MFVTQFEKQQGYINTEYFFTDKNNVRTLLRIATRSNKLEENETGIYREGTRGVYGNSTDKDSFKYLEFYVTDKKHLKDYFSDDSLHNFDKKIRDKVLKLENNKP